jgi:hypothetical protein
MTMETNKLRENIDTFLEASSLAPDIIRALNAYAGVQAHLKANGELPNEDHLQRSRKVHILDRFKPIDPDDPDVQADLADGLTIADLEYDAELFRNISLVGARWIAFALDHKVPPKEDEASKGALDKQQKVDAQLDAMNVKTELRTGLDVIAALKASVYVAGGSQTFEVFQDFRLHEIHDCFTGEFEADRQRMLDQAAWVAFALKSADGQMI